MYLRFISEQWNEQEPTENYISAFFTEYECKRGKEAFDSSFINLVKSVEAKGFEKKYFVPVDNKGRLINGAHRIAAAMVCGVNVWSLKYPFNGLYYVCNKDSLLKMGFADEQIREIESVYKALVETKEEFEP